MGLDKTIRNAIIILAAGTIVIAGSSRLNRSNNSELSNTTIESKIEIPSKEKNNKERIKEEKYKIVIDKSDFKLYLFENNTITRTYTIAVGMDSYPTPEGNFRVSTKVKNPAWYPPANADWVSKEIKESCSKDGSIKHGRKDNPMVAYWFGLGNGIGIHGTNEKESIGKKASHGCIRMKEKDIKELSEYVKSGTFVQVKN